MPFGLLKRTRRYNVSGKASFVTRIRLLDGLVVECTLSAEGTGRECLEVIAQRLELTQVSLFGLWFYTRQQQTRWVELEKALKKQLDKKAAEAVLYFGVTFPVPSTALPPHEATRYQYCLQLRSYVTEGRLRCSYEQGVRLAALSAQANFGDFNRLESQDFLRDYELFPLSWGEDEQKLEELTQRVAAMHRSCCGLSPAEAELCYIMEAEKLEGYGEESFAAKFCLGQELWHYIASQGPLPHTSHEFWQMVWEQAVCVIAMVTPEQENGQQKCHRYWSKLSSRRNTSSYGDFRVTTKFRTDSGSFATTGLRLRHLLSGQEHNIWHLHFPSWPDHGCPEDVQRFLAFLEEVQSVRRHTNSMLPPGCIPPPVLVHCSAGVGRSGVLILTELMVACIEHDERLDVPEVPGLLREQRMFMVQTFSQYCFVYQALIHFLRSARLV